MSVNPDEFEDIFREVWRLNLGPSSRDKIEDGLRKIYEDTFTSNGTKNVDYIADPAGVRREFVKASTYNKSKGPVQYAIDSAGDLEIKIYSNVFSEQTVGADVRLLTVKFSSVYNDVYTTQPKKIDPNKKELTDLQLVWKQLTGGSEVTARAIGKQVVIGAAFGTYMLTLMRMLGTSKADSLFGLKAEAIVGPVPLYSIQSMERAKSDRKLKTRAIGDVFLAHQKGNKDVFRIDGTFTGPLRFFYLWMLLQLQKTSEGREVFAADGNVSFANVTTIPEAGKSAKSNVLNYEEHRTFPIITQFQIMTNMFLQTIEWHRTVDDGQEIIKYHLLFRKWIPPTRYEVFNKGDVENSIIGASAFGLNSGKLGIARKWLEFSIDTVWKMMKMRGEIYGHIAVNSDGSTKEVLDQQAVSSMSKLITSYSGGLFGLW